MTAKRGADFDLRSAIREKGFTPRVADAKELFALLTSADDAEHAEDALVVLGEASLTQAITQLERARAPVRGRLAKVVARFAADEALGTAAVGALLPLLKDDDGPTRRAAVQGLGKSANREHESALLRAYETHEDLPTRRSIARAFGVLGGEKAAAVLENVSNDPELIRIARESLIKIRRDTVRTESTRIREDVALRHDQRIIFHCKPGFEHIVAEEAEKVFSGKVKGPGEVHGYLRGPLRTAIALRTPTYFSLPLPLRQRGGESVETTVAQLLTSKEAVEIFETFSDGPIRYRIEWIGAGHKRASTFRIAELVAKRAPSLINDTRDTPWTAEIEADVRGVQISLWPKALVDTRFDYIDERVEAASHPTVAAALAWVGGVREDDVVWDPFAGGATELIERAKLGPYKMMYGSDNEASAIEIAKATVKRAGTSNIELIVGDARNLRLPQAPTLILTNPPLGRRITRDSTLGPMLEDFLAHAARMLAPNGRLVWLSPQPARTAELLTSFGMTAVHHERVDLGGVYAELQAYEKITSADSD